MCEEVGGVGELSVLWAEAADQRNGVHCLWWLRLCLGSWFGWHYSWFDLDISLNISEAGIHLVSCLCSTSGRMCSLDLLIIWREDKGKA